MPAFVPQGSPGVQGMAGSMHAQAAGMPMAVRSALGHG